jgi:hypothetical protein
MIKVGFLQIEFSSNSDFIQKIIRREAFELILQESINQNCKSKRIIVSKAVSKYK